MLFHPPGTLVTIPTELRRLYLIVDNNKGLSIINNQQNTRLDNHGISQIKAINLKSSTP